MGDHQFTLISRLLAIVGSGLAMTSTVWGINRGSHPADGSILLDLCTTMAVIWGTKYAADNLHHLRSIQEARLSPTLDVSTRTVWFNGDRALAVELHNFGESRAVALRGRWRLLAGEFGGESEWEPLEFSNSMVDQGAHVEDTIRGDPMRYLFHSIMEIEVCYSAASRREGLIVWHLPIEDGWPARTGQVQRGA